MLVGGSKVLNILFILILVSCGVMIFEEPQIQLFIVIPGVAILFGITLVIPIGGADMPVVVSLEQLQRYCRSDDWFCSNE